MPCHSNCSSQLTILQLEYIVIRTMGHLQETIHHNTSIHSSTSFGRSSTQACPAHRCYSIDARDVAPFIKLFPMQELSINYTSAYIFNSSVFLLIKWLARILICYRPFFVNATVTCLIKYGVREQRARVCRSWKTSCSCTCQVINHGESSQAF